jgi:pimeloyl-ACP methyl ester carboxylesterase
LYDDLAVLFLRRSEGSNLIDEAIIPALTMAPALPNQYHFISPASGNSQGTRFLVFFVTGNPGLVAYYNIFLSHLYALLSTTSFSQTNKARFDVFCPCLRGFELEGNLSQHGKHTGKDKGPPYGLADQIDAIEESVKRLVDETNKRDGGVTNVILMGHSIGSYILLEIIKRHRVRLAKWTAGKVGEPDNGLRIVGGICLFPTVTHLKQSPSGRKFGVSDFLSINGTNELLVTSRLSRFSGDYSSQI